jgi:hypothetical protein
MPLIMMTLYVHASCISGNCYNGKGTFIFKDGSKYGGSFLRGKPHGQGTYHYKDGSVYTGSFHQGLKHGLGKMTFKSKDVYTGHFEKGTISGEGKMTYANGDIYLGIWQQGKFNGLGKYLFSNGDRYEGNFVNGTFTGTGRFTKTDGTYYEGEWLENKKNGNGKSYKNGELTNTFFKMDVLVDENNTKVSSESNFPLNNSKKFENDVLINCNDEYCHNTKGKLTYKDGSVFTGDFINGKGEGLGSCKYANGDYYEGGWKNHAPHGQGTMHFAKGNVYAAIWENGVPKQKINSQYQNSIPSTASTTTIKKSDNTTKIYALIAGVATYNHMPSLKYTDDDAYHLYAFLKSPEGGALPDDNIKIIVDDAVTRKSLLQELNTMTAKADENDVVLVYLSGHGLDGYYVPSDFDGSKNQVSYDDILEIINNSSAKHKLFITDACHSGSMMVAARSPYNVALENFYSAYNSVKGGTAIMMSSKKEEVSLEYGGLRQGVFSHYLIKGLKGYADTNKDKLITISELYDYVSTNVATYSANAQHPVIMGDYDYNMPVAWIRQ